MTPLKNLQLSGICLCRIYLTVRCLPNFSDSALRKVWVFCLFFQAVASLNHDHLTVAVALEIEKAFGGWVPPPITVWHLPPALTRLCSQVLQVINSLVLPAKNKIRLHYFHCFKLCRSIVPTLFYTSLTILMNSLWLGIDNLMQQWELAGCTLTVLWLKYIVLAPKMLCLYGAIHVLMS